MIGQFTRDVLKTLDDAIKACPKNGGTLQLIESFKATLLDAVKFYVADLGSPRMAELIRSLPEKLTLPFDRIVLEWLESPDEDSSGSKSITLAAMDGSYIAITSFSYFYNKSNFKWMPACLSLNIPRDVRELDLHHVDDKHYSFNSVPFKWTSIETTKEQEDWALGHLKHDAVKVMQFLAMLNCSNVESSQEVSPDEKLQRAAMKHHRYPFFTYKILTLRPSAKGAREEPTGTHLPPRMHVRRGHIRHLESGKTTWVNAHVVGRIERGVILKEYQTQTGT